MTDRLIKITTALAVVAVAVVAAIISYQHAYELVRWHGEFGVTARLLPFTVDGLIWAASMVVLDASRRSQPVPRLAAWSLGAGIMATVGANRSCGSASWKTCSLLTWPAPRWRSPAAAVHRCRGESAVQTRGRCWLPATGAARPGAATTRCW